MTVPALLGLIRELLTKPEPTSQTNDHPPAIFVVDDDSTVREALRDLLEANGRTVEVFESGEAFFDVYRPGRQGCLVVDAQMPGMDGLELLQRLRGEPPRLPAIMITGHGDVPMAVRAMKAGAVDFIEKPIGYRELLATVRRAPERARPGHAKERLGVAGERGEFDRRSDTTSARSWTWSSPIIRARTSR